MKNELLLKIKEINGNVLVIGISDQKVIKAVEANENIIVCNFLDSNMEGKRKIFGKRGKTISIKKIRRVFKKKKIDYIICNLNEISKYLRYFIKDSIFLCKGEVIYIGKFNDYNLDILMKRYQRYNVSINLKENKKEFLLNIDVSKAKNNKMKEIIYFISDILSELSNFISDFLVR